MTTTMTMRRDVALPHCCDLLNASHCSYVYLTIAFMHCHKSPGSIGRRAPARARPGGHVSNVRKFVARWRPRAAVPELARAYAWGGTSLGHGSVRS